MDAVEMIDIVNIRLSHFLYQEINDSEMSSGGNKFGLDSINILDWGCNCWSVVTRKSSWTAKKLKEFFKNLKESERIPDVKTRLESPSMKLIVLIIDNGANESSRSWLIN